MKWDPLPPLPLASPLTGKVVALYEREYLRADARSIALAEKRMTLEPGSSRARIAKLNAQWATAAEQRDRYLDRLQRARALLEACA